jgi:hypothetical protein
VLVGMLREDERGHEVSPLIGVSDGVSHDVRRVHVRQLLPIVSGHVIRA